MSDKKPVFEDHIGLVKSIVSSFDRLCSPEDSELFPVACIGLMKAIESFDPSRSKFSYWATKIIRNSMISEIRKNSNDPVPMSRIDFDGEENLAGRGSEMPLELVPFITGNSEGDTKLELENRRILLRHFLEGVSMAEIARELGFTREGIRQKVKKAIESIRKRHGEILDNHSFWLTGEV